jgi:ribosomal protein S18 acetylase RimI-like enzyme
MIRKFTWDDFPEIVRVSNEFASALGAKGLWKAEELEEVWREPQNHPEENCFVAIFPEKGLVGYLIVDVLDVPNQANGVYRVPPHHPELGRALIQAGDQHFKTLAEKASSPSDELFMLYALPSEASFAFDILEAEGYQHVRNFYTMSMTLNQDIPPLEIPQGLHLGSFRAEDARKLHEAQREMFQEHWGHYDGSFEEWIYPTTKADFDSRWWQVLWDDETIVGLVLSVARSEELAWISTLGVKKSYRQRGLAQLLLHEVFRIHQSQGRKIIELGVDADNATNATKLYLNAGMSVRQTIHYYRKTLREAGKAMETKE